MSLTIEQFVTTGFGWTVPSPNSQKSYRNHILQFEAFLKERNKTAQDGTVSDQDILDYIEYLKSKYQPNTIAAKTAAVKSYFKWLKIKAPWIHKPYIRSFASVETTHKELDVADLRIMLKNMRGAALNKRRDLAMFSLMVYCGFKTSEIVAMNTEDVDFEAVQITVIKNRKYASGIPRKDKCSFRAAVAEMSTYKNAKLQQGFCWQNLAMNAKGLTWTPAGSDNEKEPFFLNKHRLRISGRSLRRRLMSYLGKNSSYGMRDLRHTYLKNLDRIVQTNPVKV